MFAATALASAALAGLLLTGAAGAPAQASVRAGTAGPAGSTSGTSDYLCFVTYPGGSTTEAYRLTYEGSGPASVMPFHPFTVSVGFPVITPRTDLNKRVQDVRVVFRLPHGAALVSAHLAGPSARLEYGNGVVIVTAAGPFKAGSPFQLPRLTVHLMAGASGTYVLAQGGATLNDPSFSWVRTDLAGTDRPFACFAPTGTPLTHTVVTP
jgi:dehydratase